MDFEFEKCVDAVIRVNGAVLGAVTKAECTSENSYSDINEFLTDKPVYRIPSSRYRLRLEMTLGGGNPFADETHFEQIELVMKSKTLRYSDCFVESTKTTVGARGYVTTEACICAETRDVV